MVTRSSTPRDAAAPERPLHAAGLRAWAAAIAVLVVAAGAAELFLRSGVIWRVPLPYLLQSTTDRYTRAVWMVHNPPPPGRPQVIVLGSSTAAAIADLSNEEPERYLRTALGHATLELTSLSVSSGCYDEHMTLLENALEHGHRPIAVVLFSWPACLTQEPYEGASVLAARRMPLTSAWLAEEEESSLPLDDRSHAWLVRASALHRYRHTLNAWLRSRWSGLLRGQAPWAPLTFQETYFVKSWHGPWEADGRLEQFVRTGWAVAPNGQGADRLATLLHRARLAGLKVLIVESPWSPPVIDMLAGDAERYAEAMRAAASRSGAVYVNPNRRHRLPPALFHDFIHVNPTGARAYLPIVASELRRFTESS